MRHFVGLLSGLILGPVLVLVCGWTFAHLRGLHTAGLGALQGSGPVAVAGLVGVGVLVAMLAVPPRLTPMLPFGAALVVSGLTGLALLRMPLLEHLLERLPRVPGTEGALTLLPLGVFVPLALVLLAPLFVGGRWRRREEGVSEADVYFDGLYEEDDDKGRPAGAASPSGAHAPRHRA